MAYPPKAGLPAGPPPHLQGACGERSRGGGGEKKEKGEVAWWKQQRWSEGPTSPSSETQEERKRPQPSPGRPVLPPGHPPQVHITATAPRASQMHTPTPHTPAMFVTDPPTTDVHTACSAQTPDPHQGPGRNPSNHNMAHRCTHSPTHTCAHPTLPAHHTTHTHIPMTH